MTSKLRPMDAPWMRGKSATPKMDQSFTWRKKQQPFQSGLYVYLRFTSIYPVRRRKKKLRTLNHSPGAIPIDSHRFSNRYVQPYIYIYKSTRFTYESPKMITLSLLFVQPTAHPEGHTLTLHARMFLVEPQFIAEIRGTYVKSVLVSVTSKKNDIYLVISRLKT